MTHARSLDADHPPVEVLVRYHERELPEGEGVRVSAHLENCMECRQVLEEYGRFGHETPDDPASAERAKRRAWSAILRKVRGR